MNVKHAGRSFLKFVVVVAAIILAGLPKIGGADRISELRSSIDKKNTQIAALELEINKLIKDIEEAAKESQSLQREIRELDLTRRKLLVDIQVTEGKITATDLEIKKLKIEIGDTSRDINHSVDAINKSLRKINEYESQSLIEMLLAYDSLGAFFDILSTLEQYQESIIENLQSLEEFKKTLESQKTQTESHQTKLEGLRRELRDRKKLVEDNQNEKERLLRATKNRESNYKKIADEKRGLREIFERELFEFESELRIEIDARKLPGARPGVLAWPLDSITVTQYFGETNFSRSMPSVYRGQGHNGVDLRALIGTPVKTAEGGSIRSVGNTDLSCPGISYGRWILIDHGNGLSTLYAHLSLISVGVNERVKRGQVIGYSGNSGFTTGPHLHFTVFATEGIQIITRQSRVCGRAYTMPVADFRAYLNPLAYL